MNKEELENVDKALDKFTFTGKNENMVETEPKSFKAAYLKSLEKSLERGELNGAVRETVISIPEIYIDKDRDTQDFIKKLGTINANKDRFGIEVEFTEDKFDTVDGGVINIGGETITTHGEPMGVLNVITTVSEEADVENIDKLLNAL